MFIRTTPQLGDTAPAPVNFGQLFKWLAWGAAGLFAISIYKGR